MSQVEVEDFEEATEQPDSSEPESATTRRNNSGNIVSVITADRPPVHKRKRTARMAVEKEVHSIVKTKQQLTYCDHWLMCHRRWTLIYDQAGNKGKLCQECYDQYIPRSPARAASLVTSRPQPLSQRSTVSVPLDDFSEEHLQDVDNLERQATMHRSTTATAATIPRPPSFISSTPASSQQSVGVASQPSTPYTSSNMNSNTSGRTVLHNISSAATQRSKNS